MRLKISRKQGRLLFALLLPALAAVVSCRSDGGSGAEAMPRRTAYPRVDLYDSTYVAIAVADVTLEVNADATTMAAPEGRGVDITYRRYGTTIYCSVTPCADTVAMGRVVANRLERICLNVGDTELRRMPVANAEGVYEAYVFEAEGVTQTPIQFIATGDDKVVSGTAFMASPGVVADSVAPIADALKRDVIHLLTTLR